MFQPVIGIATYTQSSTKLEAMFKPSNLHSLTEQKFASVVEPTSHKLLLVGVLACLFKFVFFFLIFAEMRAMLCTAALVRSTDGGWAPSRL